VPVGFAVLEEGASDLFETFLVAPSEEKEKILVSLLGADLWQETAAAMCEEAKSEADALKTRRIAHESRMASVGAADIAALDALVDEAAGLLASARTENAGLAAELAGAELEYAQAEKLHAVFRELDEATALRERLTSDAEVSTVGRFRSRLARIDGARAAAPAVEKAKNAQEEHSRRLKDTELAFMRLEKAEARLDECEKRYIIMEEKNAHRPSLDAELHRLTGLRGVYESCTRIRAACDEAARLTANSDRELAALRTKLEHEESELERLDAERERIITEVVTILPELRENARNAAEISKLLGELDALCLATRERGG